MRDSTIITHADVYSDQAPSTSSMANGVMRSGDSPPSLRASIPSSYDIAEQPGIDGRITMYSSPAATITTSTEPLGGGPDRGNYAESEAEVISIDEVAPIVGKTILTIPEPRTINEKNNTNGLDRDYSTVDGGKKIVNDPDDDPCIVKCIYFTQQCCECTIS